MKSGIQLYPEGSAAGNFNKEADWSRLARCKANSGREPQTFVLLRGVWTKFVQVRMTGGGFTIVHFISLLSLLSSLSLSLSLSPLHLSQLFHLL